MKLFTKWLVCFCVLVAAAWCFPLRFTVHGGILSLAAAATVLWLANIAIRPVLQIVSLPVTLLTFGLFSLVVNAGMVRLTDWILPVIQIRGFFFCLMIALFISLLNSVLAVKRHRH